MFTRAAILDTGSPGQNPWSCCIEAAELLCQCDRRTAERLVFVRWLVRTGRLQEDTATEEPAYKAEGSRALQASLWVI